MNEIAVLFVVDDVDQTIGPSVASEWVEKRQRRVTVGRPKKSLGRKILQGSPREGDPNADAGSGQLQFSSHACGASLAYDF